MGEANAAIIHRAYEDFARGDAAAVFAAFDPAITWHVPGHGPLSGDYAGHAAIGAFFRQSFELSGGSFRMDVHKVLAADDTVVVLVTVHAERNGEAAAFPEVHVWRMRDGKAVAFHEYQGDEQREDRFWS